MRNAVLAKLGGQLVRQHVRYEATVQLVVRGAGTLRSRATLTVSTASCTALWMFCRQHVATPAVWHVPLAFAGVPDDCLVLQ